ncbi:hypothetical protein M407DRAFT_6960 [Tulasnella calospora MUT 4182]|uniref:WSC domain-containing protein n=1 Tax=Tulasnella calospora MUT 4182 TaxID=1051891 RepID=A0A0C3QBW3_9AGAM|nr:hypothetical protein M407DRAFT_6960 [Tulasnella calospora MUT 4182]
MANLTFFYTLLSLAIYAPSTLAFFRMGAKVLLATRMDSIVSPGAVSAHMHNIAGGNRFSSTYDYDDLRKSTCTSNLVNIDHSNYWAPGLHYVNKTGGSTTFSYIPSYYTVYYLDRNGSKKEKVHAWPGPLKMLAGNPNRRTYNSTSVSDMAVSKSSPQTTEFPKNNCPNGLRAQIVFPSCWDGQNYDSADHMSHMAYPIDGHPDSGNCPSTHPVRLVTLFYEQVFDVGSFPYNGAGSWVLSNGDDTGYGFHADFQNGWEAGDNSLLQQAIDQCTNLSGELTDCPVLKPYLDDDAKEACQPVNPIPDEDVGYRGPGVTIGTSTPTVPGCNPIWTGTGPKPTCSTNPPVPAFKSPQSVLPAGWTAGKCMADGPGPRVLQGASLVDSVGMTRAKCAAFCDSKGFKYAGVEWSQECYCGNALVGAVESPDSACHRTCKGEPYENCGGDAHITLLTKTGASSNPSTSTTTKTTTTTTKASTSAATTTTVKASTTTTKAATTTTKTTATPSGTASTTSTWKLQGCLAEPQPARALWGAYLSDPAMTVEKCTSYCKSKGFTLAGLEYG